MKKPKGYWTKERCHEEAKKYEYRSDFVFGSESAYRVALRKGWLDEICSHMGCKGNRYIKLVYVYKFRDNHFYVGLTGDIETRHQSHFNNKASSVYQHMQKTGLVPTCYTLTDYIDAEDAAKLEGEYKAHFESLGMVTLNKVKTGGLGGNYKIWFEENISEEANKHNHKIDFQRAAPGAYDAAFRMGILDDVCAHMTKKKQGRKFTFSDQHIWDTSMKYTRVGDFRELSPQEYNVAVKRGMLKDMEHLAGRQFRKRAKVIQMPSNIIMAVPLAA